MFDNDEIKQIKAGVLNVAYLELGNGDTGQQRPSVILLHGFPYDVQAYAQVAPAVAAAGYRVIVPYLRGYGPTTFLRKQTLRSGQQAVLANDLLSLMDALHIERAVLGGYDWGGRAACIVSALWPQRVQGLVSCNGYNLQNIPGASSPQHPENEYKHWYQYYFHSERGRAGLSQNKRELCKLLWRLWSPNWDFDEPTFERTARSFDNPDFVDVVIHSYRHRYALVEGDPSVERIEQQLTAQPAIVVPAIVLDGDGDGVAPIGMAAGHARHFNGPYERRVVPLVGHNLPQEAPTHFTDAIFAMLGAA